MRRPVQHSSSSGFSLLETVIGMSVMIIGLLAMTSTSVVVHSLDESDKARRLATTAQQAVIDQLNVRAAALVGDEAGWATALTDSYGDGGTPGSTFAVQGLDPWEGMAQIGSVRVVTDETITDDELGGPMGMPRDLDGDGLVSNEDVTASATLLPVVLRIRWTGESGDRELVHGLYVLGY